MADLRITGLPLADDPNGSEAIPVDQAGITKQLTVTQVAAKAAQAARAAFGLTKTQPRPVITASGVIPIDEYGLRLIDATSGPITLTLPDIASWSDRFGGMALVLLRVDDSANAVQLVAGASDTLDGGGPISIGRKQRITLMEDHTDNWYVITWLTGD